MAKSKLLRITTVPISLFSLLKGQLCFMNQYYSVKGITSEGHFREIAERYEGVEIIPVEMTRIISPLKDLKSVWLLYRIFKKEKPHIVHTHTPKAGTVGMIAAKLAGVPHRLHTIAGLPLLEVRGNKRKLLDAVEKFTYACATKVYPNSKGLYDIILENRYTKEDKLKVIGNGSSNGIDTSHFSKEHYSYDAQQKLREELGFKKNDFIFIFIGRLVKDKGINELVEAFSMLSGKEPHPNIIGQNTNDDTANVDKIKLLLVGPYETELDPLLTDTLEQIENNPHIKSVGYQKDVRPYFAIADALVFPSYREGFPNVVMQAGAMGLPSIVSNINGCNEIIIEDENGIIVPSKNTEALRHAMNRFVEDRNLINKLKSNARKMIVERYEQQVVWEAILSEYKSLENRINDKK